MMQMHYEHSYATYVPYWVDDNPTLVYWGSYSLRFFFMLV